MTRWIGRLATGLGLLAALAGCHAAEPQDGKVHIRFSGYAGNPAETDLMRRLVDRFNATHPGIVVAFEPVPGQYYPKLLTMLVSKTAPDVFYLDSLEFKPFLAKHVLLPLDGYIAKSPTTQREAFMPTLIDTFSADGHTYGLPKDFNTLALFYNKDAFDRAHLPYPDASWSYDKLSAAAKTLTANGKYGLSIPSDRPERFLPIADAYGGGLYDAQGHCELTSEPVASAMQLYAGLKFDGSAVFPSEVGSTWPGDVFGTQRVAMVCEGGWLMPYLRDNFPKVRYGLTELPQGPKGRGNMLFTVAYCIPTSSHHPDAAWQLMSYLTSAEVQAQVDIALPSRKALSAPYIKRHPEYAPIFAGAAYARPFEFGVKGDRVQDRFGVALQEIMLGAKGQGPALADACRDIDEINRL